MSKGDRSQDAQKAESGPPCRSSGAGSDLFGEPALPAGFRYTADVLSPAEEKDLVGRIEKLPFKPFEFHGYLGNRRIYTFGHKYIFAGQEPRADAGIPDYLRPLTVIAGQISETPPDAFEQLMVTQYAPGAGIGWHRDRPTFENIVAVSFLAPCVLRLRRGTGMRCASSWASGRGSSIYLVPGTFCCWNSLKPSCMPCPSFLAPTPLQADHLAMV